MEKSKSSTVAPAHQFPRHPDADKAIGLYIDGLDAAVRGAGFGGEHLEALKKIHQALIDRDALAAALDAAVDRMEAVAEGIPIHKRRHRVSPATHVAHMAGHLEQHAKKARAALAELNAK